MARLKARCLCSLPFRLPFAILSRLCHIPVLRSPLRRILWYSGLTRPPESAFGSEYTMAEDKEKQQPTHSPGGWSRRKKWVLFITILATMGLIVTLALVFALPCVGAGGSCRNKTEDSNPVGTGEPSSGPSVPRPAWTDGFPNPEKTVGHLIPNNDIYQTLDPTLVRRSDGRVFLYTTGGEYGKSWEAPSLHGPWTQTSKEFLPSPGGAPSVHLVDDKYYMFYNSHEYDYLRNGVENPEAASKYHDASILVQTSESLEVDSWELEGRLSIPWSMDYNILDAALLSQDEDADGPRHLLAFGSYQTGLYHVPLEDPPVKLADDAMASLRHVEHNSTEYLSLGRDRTEASYPYRPSNGDYTYLFFSSGKCCRNHETKKWAPPGEEYKMMVCRQKRKANVPDNLNDSDYFDREGRNCLTDNGGTIVVASHGEVFAPGGGGVYEDPDQGLIIYYHYLLRKEGEDEPRKGYLFGWNKLHIDEQGWPVIGA